MTTQGSRLKKIRCALNLSQTEFGEQIGLSRAGVAAVEGDKNKFSQDVLYKVSMLFHINLNYLVCGNGNMFIDTCEDNHEKNETSLKISTDTQSNKLELTDSEIIKIKKILSQIEL